MTGNNAAGVEGRSSPLEAILRDSFLGNDLRGGRCLDHVDDERPVPLCAAGYAIGSRS